MDGLARGRSFLSKIKQNQHIQTCNPPSQTPGTVLLPQYPPWLWRMTILVKEFKNTFEVFFLSTPHYTWPRYTLTKCLLNWTAKFHLCLELAETSPCQACALGGLCPIFKLLRKDESGCSDWGQDDL